MVELRARGVDCRYYPLRGRVGGFTLIELLVVMGVMIILSTVGVPQFTAAFQKQRTIGEITSLYNDLQYARSEAIKQGQMVALCLSTDGTSCNGTSWHAGWIVYSAGATPGFVAGTSFVLRVQPGFSTGDTIATSPTNVTSVTFNRDGFSQGLAASGLLFTLTNSTSNTAATRCLWLDLLGRAYIQKSGGALAPNGQAASCT